MADDGKPFHCDPKTVALRRDAVTAVMGYRAELSGGLSRAKLKQGQLAKNVLIQGFASEKDSMTWNVVAPSDGHYSVSVIIAGSREILDGCEMEIRTAADALTAPVLHRDWDGKPFYCRQFFPGTLALNKGENRVTLRLSRLSQGQKETTPDFSLNPSCFSVWSVEFGTPEARALIDREAAELPTDTSWLVDRVYGLFVHWSPIGCYTLEGNQPLWTWYDEAARLFDVQAFADAVAETGAGWVCFVTTHGKHYWPGPSETIDRILPGRTSTRDLIGDLAEALAARDVRLTLYYHSGLNGDEDRDWVRAVGALEPDPSPWYCNVESLFEETSLRYGRLVDGIAYFDGGMFMAYQLDPPWGDWARALKRGNPTALVGVSQNYGPVLSPFHELEVNDGGGALAPAKSASLYGNGSQLGNVTPARWLVMDAWVNHQMNGRFRPPRFDADRYIEYFTRLQREKIPVTINLAITADVTRERPFFNPDCVAVMREMRNAIRHSKEREAL